MKKVFVTFIVKSIHIVCPTESFIEHSSFCFGLQAFCFLQGTDGEIFCGSGSIRCVSRCTGHVGRL